MPAKLLIVYGETAKVSRRLILLMPFKSQRVWLFVKQILNRVFGEVQTARDRVIHSLRSTKNREKRSPRVRHPMMCLSVVATWYSHSVSVFENLCFGRPRLLCWHKIGLLFPKKYLEFYGTYTKFKNFSPKRICSFNPNLYGSKNLPFCQSCMDAMIHAPTNNRP